MNTSDLLQATIDAEIALCGKGYLSPEVHITVRRMKYAHGRPWCAGIRRDEYTSRYDLLESYATPEEAVAAIEHCVAEIERKWDDAAVAATLGIAPYAALEEDGVIPSRMK